MSKPANSLPVKVTLLLVSTLTVMSNATIAPSLPLMRESFINVNNVDYLVRLVLTAPSLFVAIGAPFAGFIIDQLGRKPLLTITLLVYGLAGSSGLWLNSLGLILVGRALLGLSVAGIMTTVLTLIADYYVGSARTQFLGWQSAFSALGGVVFLSVGGFLADIGWRLPFLIYLIAWLFVPLVLMFLPEPSRTSQSATQQNTPIEPTTLPLGIVVFTYGIALLVQAVFYMIPVQLPFYLKSLTNATASESGLAIAFGSFFVAVGSLLYQRIKARLTFISVYSMGFISMGVGYGVISLANSYAIVLLGLAIAGFGLGLLVPNMNLCLTSITPAVLRGRTLGGLTTCFFLGQFISPLLSQPLGQLVGLSIAYRLAGILLVVLALMTLAVMSRHKNWA
ncbi:MFS transporter [Iningainema tapete]|uniref:MFS transporter n=1 Tax=Iningainema tapete BLCC-T55 TaxID=2748662 RepID=A0A8J7CCA1_9CYAN|nr:MFS transporter [Iningainema tapete]MBD2772230.1 MFS transporter [Iningainema tapete BLCC-T55]